MSLVIDGNSTYSKVVAVFVVPYPEGDGPLFEGVIPLQNLMASDLSIFGWDV